MSVKLARLNDLLSVAAPPDGATAANRIRRNQSRRFSLAAIAAWACIPCSTPCGSDQGEFGGMVFLSVGVVDSGNFKGAGAVDELCAHMEASARKICRACPPARNALGQFHVDRHRRRRRTGASVRGGQKAIAAGVIFAGNRFSSVTRGINACCITKPPIRCSDGYNGTACPWSFCPPAYGEQSTGGQATL